MLFMLSTRGNARAIEHLRYEKSAGALMDHLQYTIKEASGQVSELLV